MKNLGLGVTERAMKSSVSAFAILLGVAGGMSSVHPAPAQSVQQKQTVTPSTVSPQTVCTFISGQMQSALPQVPTLCSGKQEVPGYYEINVFSPKDVLEGDMRQAWSSALFQTMEALVSEKSLKGVCSSKEPVCFVSVSDSLMARDGTRYRFILSKADVEGQKDLAEANHWKEFSDSWYLAWWDLTVMNSKESEHPKSKGNAELIAMDACNDYLQANALTFQLQKKPPPICSVLLATDRAVYVEMDFSDFFGALTFDTSAYLAKTIGRAFDRTAYDGQVIIKSPWMKMPNGTEQRVYYTVSLHGLEFLSEEMQSGTRSEADSHMIFVSHYRSEGQTTKSDLFRSDQKDGLIIRNAAVINVKFGQGKTVSLQTTDGAEWQLSEENLIRCGASPGSDVSIIAVPEKSPSMSVVKSGESCRMDVTFVSGW